MHPRHHVAKEYRVLVKGSPTTAELQTTARGHRARRRSAPVPPRSTLVGAEGAGAVVRIVLREGRKRQVRRMLGAVRHPVVCSRVRLGLIVLGDQAPGTLRPLTAEESAALKRAAGMSADQDGRRRGPGWTSSGGRSSRRSGSTASA